MISDFTMHIRNLNLKGDKIYDEISELVRHVDRVLKEEDKTINNTDQIIYDVNFPVMTLNQLDSVLEINELELQKLQKQKKNQKIC